MLIMKEECGGANLNPGPQDAETWVDEEFEARSGYILKTLSKTKEPEGMAI